ncbi:MAG: PIN domain-containing protein [Nanoarchaeota archaeon]|nr:PIN domain-containing protein [Nanoarchaeota archaeon]
MTFVIDTNILVELERDNKVIISKLEGLDLIKGNIYITSPSYSEFYLGLLNKSNEKLEKEKERLDKYKLLNTTKNSSKLLAEIKHKVTKAGTMIPIFDLLIASIVMDSRMPLVTLDGHFKKIQNLNVILIE